MNSAQTCPRCGALLSSSGPCPRCELSLALAVLPVSAGPAVAEGAGEFRRFGDYELLEELGHGGMGVVYRARHIKLDRIVALKMLLLGQFSSDQAVQRFQREAQAAAALRHPNIVALHDVGQTEGQHYLTMEFVEGRALSSCLRDGPLPPRQAAAHLRALAEAVSAAHAAGIVHRDLKPSNILIDMFEQPRITDFGLAKRLDDSGDLTVSGNLLGSPNYLAPELTTGRKEPASAATDIYSLGAILYECLTGRPPFLGATLHETLLRIGDSEPLAPRVLDATLPRDLETICLKCLEKEPSRRYATAQELADELGRFIQGEPVQARPVSRTEKVWRWCRRKPAIATLGAIVLVLLLVVVFGAPIAILRIDRARATATSAQIAVERNLYSADMQLASEALRDGALGQVRELLDRHVPAKGAEDPRGFEWRYLQGAANQTGLVTRQLQGLTSSKMLYDHRLVIVSNTLYNIPFRTYLDFHEDPLPIRAWDLTTWAPLPLDLPDHPNCEWWFFPEQQAALAINAKDLTIAVYHLPHLEPGPVIPLPGKAIQAAVSKDFRSLAVVFQDGDVQRVLVWDLQANSQRAIFGKSRGNSTEIEFSPDSKVLLVEWDEIEIALWSITEGKALPSPVRDSLLNGDREPFFAPHSTQLLINKGFSPDLRIWDWSSGKLSTVRQADLSGLYAYAFSPDAALLAAAWGGEVIVLSDTKDFRQIGTLRGHSGFIGSIVFSPSGSLVATASRDHTAKLWDPKAQRELATLGGNEQKVAAVAFTPDEKSVLTLGGDGAIKVWNVQVLLKRGVFLKTTKERGRFALSADQRLLATSDSAVHVRDLARGEEIHSFTTDEFFPCKLAFSPTDPLLAWVGEHSLGILNYQSGQTNLLQVAGPWMLGCAVFSADGRDLAFTTRTNIMFCDMATLKLRTFAWSDRQVHALAFSPNGFLLASGQEGGGLSLWNRITGSKIVEIPGALAHMPGVVDVGFSRDGRFLASAGADATGKLWEVTSGGLRLRHTLRGDRCYMNSLQFSPDGRRVVSCGNDHTVKLWDTESGLEVGTLYGHRALVNQAAFSEDGNTIYSIGFDRELRNWQAPPFARFAPLGRRLSEPPAPQLKSTHD